MSIKIEMLRCFVTVAQTGSLSAAAARLGRTMSAVSMTLKQLEDHLEQRLFESERKNKLTPLGEYVLETAQVELNQFDNTVRSIETFARTPHGLVRIVSVPSIAALVFPTAIDRFAALHPNVAVEMQDIDAASILAGLTRGDFDIGIATANGTLRDIAQDVLFEDQFGLVCAHDHPLALQKPPVTLDDIDNFPLVQNDISAAITNTALQHRHAKTKLSARNTMSLISIIRAKPWVTVLPRSVIQIDPQKLAFREIKGLTQARQVDLLYKTTQNSGFIHDFIAILKQESRFQAL